MEFILNFFKRFFSFIQCLITFVMDIIKIIWGFFINFLENSWYILMFIALFGVGSNFLLNNY